MNNIPSDFAVGLFGEKSAKAQDVADAGSDSVLPMLYELCRVLYDSGGRVTMGGFGQPDWSIDTIEDGPDVMDGVSGVLRWCNTGAIGQYVWHLSSPHLQRALYFTKNDTIVDIECQSGREWTPAPRHVEIEKDQLEIQMRTTLNDLAKFSYKVDPRLKENEHFQSFLNQR